MSEKKTSGPGPDLREAMKISDPAEAEAWIKGYVAWLMERDPTLEPKEAIKVAVHNVCYHAAIYAHTQLVDVQKTFGGRHPVYQAGPADEGASVDRPSVPEVNASPSGPASGAKTVRPLSAEVLNE